MTARYLSPTGFDVYVIRHGESTNNVVQGADRAAYESVRESDPGLSQNGLRQAEYLGGFMAANHDIKIAKGKQYAVFTSPMRRAAETAHAVAKALRVDLEVWTDVFENKGCQMKGQSYPGDSRSTLQQRYPGVILPDTCTEEGWHLQPIETEDEAWVRAQRVVDRLFAMSRDPEYQGKGVALVTHGNFMDYLFGRFVRRSEMKGLPRFLFSNTCYSRIHFKEPVPLLLYIDRNDHLAGLLTRYDSTMHEAE